jgi:hypothetical protein
VEFFEVIQIELTRDWIQGEQDGGTARDPLFGGGELVLVANSEPVSKAIRTRQQ